MSTDEPPHPDAGAGDRDDAGQPQIVVDDPEDFAKTRQLRSIFNARDDYIKARRDANRLWEDRELDWPSKNRRIFRHLQDLAMTMEPLLKSYDSGREIWHENTYGVDRRVVAASELASFDDAIAKLKNQIRANEASDEALRLFKRYKRNQKEKRNRFGLSSSDKTTAEIRIWATDWGWKVQGLGELIERTHTLKFPNNRAKNEFGTTAPLPEVSDAAFRDLQDFIRDIGLGVQFDTTQQTKIDDDLLKEVDQWRQENIN